MNSRFARAGILASIVGLTGGSFISSTSNPSAASAASVYSGEVNLSIPDDINGLYINVVSGATSTSAFSGFDINLYGSSDVISFYTSSTSGPAATRGFVSDTTSGPASNLAPGTTVSASSTFDTGVVAGTNFPAGTMDYFGFKFLDEVGGAAHAGWGLVSIPSTPGPFTLVSYAYDTRNNTNSSIVVGNTGVAPEPASMSLVIVGGTALLNRRRRAI